MATRLLHWRYPSGQTQPGNPWMRDTEPAARRFSLRPHRREGRGPWQSGALWGMCLAQWGGSSKAGGCVLLFMGRMWPSLARCAATAPWSVCLSSDSAARHWTASSPPAWGKTPPGRCGWCWRSRHSRQVSGGWVDGGCTEERDGCEKACWMESLLD